MGKRTKIAPVLRDVLACGDTAWRDVFGDRGIAARRQAQAALAVAKAAGWYRNKGRPMGVGLRCVCQGQGACAGCSLERALARLSRASGGGRDA